jgi:hypothetical protein
MIRSARYFQSRKARTRQTAVARSPAYSQTLATVWDHLKARMKMVPASAAAKAMPARISQRCGDSRME